MNYKVISYFCDVDDSLYYEKCSVDLIRALDKFDLPYEIEKLNSLGSYKLNCSRKPKYILDKLEEHDCPLLWLDIDTILLKNPVDFAALPDSIDIALSTAVPNLSGIKASPLFFNSTENTKNLLRSWISAVDNNIKNDVELFDHEPLFGIVSEYIEKINIGFVGPDYCTWPGQETDSTVIVMGLSDVDSKKESLRKMGMSEDVIEWQSVGRQNEN